MEKNICSKMELIEQVFFLRAVMREKTDAAATII